MKVMNLYSLKVVLAGAFSVLLLSASSCEDSAKETDGNESAGGNLEKIQLISPSDGSEINLADVESVTFSWETLSGINAYKIKVSLSEDMSSSQELNAVKTPYACQVEDLDSKLGNLGVKLGATAKVYWTVIAWGSEDKYAKDVRSLKVTRLPEENQEPYEKRIADPITVKVAVLYEDPIVPGTDKYMHQVCRVGGNGNAWYDPTEQVKKFEADLEEASHGVVQYEIVKEVRAERLFSYYSQTTSLKKKYFTIETMRDSVYANGTACPGIGSGVEYDYVGMLTYYGFDKMVDDGEISEVWVYNHPGCGMYESRLVGSGAFWLNSPGISTGAPCKELCTVMFCNYERTTDLALHSYGHRVESIMQQVYGRWRTINDANLPARKADLNNWELFSSYGKIYSKYEDGYSQVGVTHFPPNASNDYEYGNRSTYVYTYADSWFDYPNMKMENARRVNASEWGASQQGWMMYMFSHLPHFKGINSKNDDWHLNNWWYYIVDYNGAKKYERQLLNE